MNPSRNIPPLGPEQVKLISQAFDEAWASVAGSFEEDPRLIESARSRLADAVLAQAARGIHEVAALKHAALQVFADEWQRRGTLPKLTRTRE